MKNNEAMNFKVRAYGRTELAQMYCPNLQPESAFRKLCRWISLEPELSRRLLKNGKIAVEGIADQMPAAGVAAASAMNNEVRDEAIGALTMLGFSPAPSAKVVSAILTDNPQLPVEQVVKLALKQIK